MPDHGNVQSEPDIQVTFHELFTYCLLKSEKNATLNFPHPL